MSLVLFHRIANRVIRGYQSLLGIPTLGARAIILNEKNEILLVKHTYQAQWYIPGGGINKGESAQSAVCRELKEEVGVVVVGAPELFGVYHHVYLGVDDYPVIYVVKNYTMVDCSSPEIEQMGWFDYTSLPSTTSPGTLRRLNEYFLQLPRADRW